MHLEPPYLGVLATILKCPTITTLEIVRQGEPSLDKKGVIKLCQFLCIHCKKITNFSFSVMEKFIDDNFYGFEDLNLVFPEFLKLLAHMPLLKHLDLSNNRLFRRVSKPLWQAFTTYLSKSKITSLDLWGDDSFQEYDSEYNDKIPIFMDGLKVLFEALENSKTLTQLSLHDCFIGYFDDYFQEYFGKDCQLKYWLANLIRNNRSITTLDLKGNNLFCGVDALDSIFVKAIKQNSTLTKLNLIDGNAENDDTLIHKITADILSKHPTLIDFGKIILKSREPLAFRSWIDIISTCQHQSIGLYLGLEADHCIMLANALLQNKTITGLDLHLNAMAPERMLDTSDFPIPDYEARDKALSALFSILSKSKTLRAISLDYHHFHLTEDLLNTFMLFFRNLENLNSLTISCQIINKFSSKQFSDFLEAILHEKSNFSLTFTEGDYRKLTKKQLEILKNIAISDYRLSKLNFDQFYNVFSYDTRYMRKIYKINDYLPARELLWAGRAALLSVNARTRTYSTLPDAVVTKILEFLKPQENSKDFIKKVIALVSRHLPPPSRPLPLLLQLQSQSTIPEREIETEIEVESTIGKRKVRRL